VSGPRLGRQVEEARARERPRADPDGRLPGRAEEEPPALRGGEHLVEELGRILEARELDRLPVALLVREAAGAREAQSAPRDRDDGALAVLADPETDAGAVRERRVLEPLAGGERVLAVAAPAAERRRVGARERRQRPERSEQEDDDDGGAPQRRASPLGGARPRAC